MELIKTNLDLCNGCNRCVRECPMEMANITYQDESGNIKVKIDQDKCIDCGRCLPVCKRGSRYYVDDTARFFDDLAAGVPISIIAAPAIRSNIPEWGNLFTYLKQLGVNQFYDVSLGADICSWGHIRYMQNTGAKHIITQPCPAVVSYFEIYKPDLLKYLSPIHSPMACVSIYMKEYQGITDRIAALSPCVAKGREFKDTGLAQYNITFATLSKYIEDNNIILPGNQTGFDHDEGSLGFMFPVQGGLKENIEFFTGKTLSIDKAGGYSMFDTLDTYAESPEEHKPHILEALNCQEGCNIGTACLPSKNIFKINREMDGKRKEMAENQKKEYFESLYKKYDEILSLPRFMRKYKAINIPLPAITDDDLENAFLRLDKPDQEKQTMDCGACGNDSCREMARKIALGVNIPKNCIIKALQDVQAEQIKNVQTKEQLDSIQKSREADERVRLLFDAMPIVAHFWDENLNLVDCNMEAVKLFNLSSKQEYLDRYFELTPEFQPDGTRSVEKLRKIVKQAYIRGHARIKEWMRQTLDGVPIPVEVVLVRVNYKNKNLIAGYCRDLRESKRMMRSLDESNKKLKMALKETEQVQRLNELQLKKLELVVKASKIGLWDMEVRMDDPINPTNIITWSDEFRELLGYKEEWEFPNAITSLNNSMHPDDFERVSGAIARHLMDKTGKTPYEEEYRLRRKDGEYGYFRATGETIRDGEGNPLHVAGALVDITETKNIIINTEKQRLEAEAANQAKSAFLSTMSHEIRTPMNAILGITEIQLQNDMLDKGLRDALEKIYASGDMLLGIINDILDLSKIEAGKMELVSAKYDTASLISDTAQLNIMRIGSKSIEFELCVDENLPAVLIGDELRVKQILNNLLSNAFKYTDKGKVKMTVSSQPYKNMFKKVMLVVSVSDTGHGMTEEQVSSLFNEYARFNLEANRTTEGTGLGMSITRNLIHLMEGEITIESNPGKGSVFTVYLPQYTLSGEVLGKEKTENLQRFRAASRAQMKRVQIKRNLMPYGRVLIVDDVETNIFVAKGLLIPYRLTIDSVDSGFGAIDKIKEGQVYDIIFMDHMMPKMDGVETTKILREMGYHHTIVALTANAVMGQSEVFIKNGFNDFISKPVDIRQLNTVLNKYIRDKQTPETLEAVLKLEEAASGQSSETEEPPGNNAKITEIFIRDANKSISVLEEFIEKCDSCGEGDIRAYTIHTHGMKSALANIGNMALSSVAYELEQMGRENSIDEIREKTPVFLTLLKLCVDELTPKENTIKPEDEDTTFLREKLLAIKAACEDFNETAADEEMAEIKKKPWAPPTKELLDNISEQLLHSDFDEIINEIDTFLR